MPEIQFVCPVCNKKENVEIDAKSVQESIRNPVPIVFTHGAPEHAITVFVDKEYRVRATSVSNIVQRIEDIEKQGKSLDKRYIPFPKSEKVSLTGLDNAQVTIVALADGKKSTDELAHILDLSEMKIKIYCQQLVKLGKLETVQVVIEEK
jgi:hypothetical protein